MTDDDLKPLTQKMFYWTLGVLVSIAIAADTMRWQSWENHWEKMEERWKLHEKHAHEDAVTKAVFTEYRKARDERDKANTERIQLLREENRSIKKTLGEMQTDIRIIREKLGK